MSKTKALSYTALCVGLAIVFYVASLSVCGNLFIIMALLLGSVWAYKFVRDRGIIRNARIGAQRTPELLPPPMTSPGSSRLFVPPPLDRNQ